MTRTLPRAALIVMFSASLLACRDRSLPEVGGQAANATKWADILAAPESYYGQQVRLTGWCRVEFEGNALYATEAAFKERDVSKALWLPLGWPVAPKTLALDGREVIVQGRVGRFLGPANSFRAALSDIQTIQAVANLESSDRSTARSR